MRFLGTRLLSRTAVATVGCALTVLAVAATGATADPVGAIQPYTVPAPSPSDGLHAGLESIVAGPDGRLWYPEYNRNAIGRITTGGATERFGGLSSVSSSGGTCGTGTCNFSSAAPYAMVFGPAGRFWLVESKRGSFASVGLDGVVSEAAEGVTDGATLDLTEGPDGNLWSAEYERDSIVRIAPAGGVTHFSAGLTAGAKPWGITAGSDGAIWFAENGRAALGRITTGGLITEVTSGISAALQDVVGGPDGNLWFTEPSTDAIGRLNPATGNVTEFHSGITSGASPAQIAVGPDGNLWFTESNRGVARITTAGEVTEFPFTSSDFSRHGDGVGAGPDGNIWFSDGYNTIAKIGTGAPAAVKANPSVSGSLAAGEAQACNGAQFATWGGLQPSPGGVTWTFNGVAAGAGQTFTPSSPGTLSCSVSAFYAAQKVPATATSATVSIAPPRKRQTTCSIKRKGKKVTLKCKTKLVAASAKLKRPKKSKSVTLKFKRGKKSFKVKGVATAKQLQLLLPAALPKGSYKVKFNGKTVSLKIG